LPFGNIRIAVGDHITKPITATGLQEVLARRLCPEPIAAS
jgi:hypothetical protein